jgi:hypothetical protein
MATVVARSATEDMHRRPQAPLGKTRVLAALEQATTACSITMGARDDDVADDIDDTDVNEASAARRRERPTCAVRASAEDGRMFGDGVATTTRHTSNTGMQQRVAPLNTGRVEACVSKTVLLLLALSAPPLPLFFTHTLESRMDGTAGSPHVGRESLMLCSASRWNKNQPVQSRAVTEIVCGNQLKVTPSNPRIAGRSRECTAARRRRSQRTRPLPS